MGSFEDPSEWEAYVRSLMREILRSGRRRKDLVEFIQGDVLAFFVRAGCSHHDARDLCQEVLWQILSNLDRYDAGRSTFRVWMGGICRKNLLNWKRKEGRRRSHSQRVTDMRGTDEERKQKDVLRKHRSLPSLNDYIERLSEDQRETLRHMREGRTSAEIAEAMGCSITVAVRLIAEVTTRIRDFFDGDMKRDADDDEV